MSRKLPSPVLSALFASIIFSPIVSAKTLVPADYLDVRVPLLHPGFSFSLAALALKPGASNLNYVIYNKELPTQSPSWTEKELDPEYRAAFALGVAYAFCDGTDLRLQWTHLSSDTSATTIAPDESYFLGPDYEIGPDAIPVRNAHGSADFRYDVINLDLGQYVDFGTHMEMRFFMGLSNTYLRERVHVNYSGSVLTGPFQGPFSTKQKVSSNFYGLGPRVGIEGNYGIGNGFGLFGEGAISALIGDMRSKTDYVSSAPELSALFNQSVNYQTIKDKQVTQVVPGLDAQIGVSYLYPFCDGGSFIIKAGYQAAVYTNAISQYIPASLVEPFDTGGIFVATMSHTLSNYSVHGFFLEGKVQI